MEETKLALNNITANNCCGCRACEQICPTKCISMKADDEGFMLSSVNINKCINCGQCERVCPVIHVPGDNGILKIYAMQLLDEETLMYSSSGGAFRLIADEIIENNGVVCSCVFNEKNEAVFRIVDTKDQLKTFQGSKYVQSDTNDVFSSVKEFLENSVNVFFSGAPCQCAALLNFLGKTYDNLYTADFLCHGMPSDWIFKEYLNYLGDKGHCKITNIRFRDKTARGWGLWFSYEKETNNKRHKIIRNVNLDPYEYAFQKSMMNRHLCYKCPFQGQRFTDFTYADYWGVENYHSDFLNKKGVSVLCLNTPKAQNIIIRTNGKANFVETSIESVAAQNESLVGIEPRPIPDIRNRIYKEVKDNGWQVVSRDVLKYKHFWINKIWYSLPHELVNLIKR